MGRAIRKTTGFHKSLLVPTPSSNDADRAASEMAMRSYAMSSIAGEKFNALMEQLSQTCPPSLHGSEYQILP